MRHIISVLLENESGALSRVAGLFSARSFNIESLSVAPSEDLTASRMTIVTSGNDAVIEVSEITSSDHIEREIVFVKIKDSDIENENLKSLKTNEFLKIHKAENGHAIIECVDSPENVNEFINTVKDIAIKIIRSGAVGIGS